MCCAHCTYKQHATAQSARAVLWRNASVFELSCLIAKVLLVQPCYITTLLVTTRVPVTASVITLLHLFSVLTVMLPAAVSTASTIWYLKLCVGVSEEALVLMSTHTRNHHTQNTTTKHNYASPKRHQTVKEHLAFQTRQSQEPSQDHRLCSQDRARLAPRGHNFGRQTDMAL